MQAEFERVSAAVGEGAAALQACMAQMEEMQGELDERSSNTHGGSGPVTRARKAIAALTMELKGMDVKLGVTRQQLLHLNYKVHLHMGG